MHQPPILLLIRVPRLLSSLRPVPSIIPFGQMLHNGAQERCNYCDQNVGTVMMMQS
jgi:hypothetical protein